MPLIALLLALLADPPKRFLPVPPSQVHGRTFTSPDGWFSIDAPGDGWEWLNDGVLNAGDDMQNPGPKGIAWIAHGPEWKDSFVMIESRSETDDALNDSYIAALERKFREIYARDGLTMSRPVVERINLPLAGSLHYHYTTTAKDGKVKHHFGYVTGRVHRVHLLEAVDEPPEPPRFKRAVVSLRWLKEP
jgi:hypothetical protein